MKLPENPGFGRVWKRTRPDGRAVYVATHRDRDGVRRSPTFPTARAAIDFYDRAYREWPGRGTKRVRYSVGQMVGEYLAHREGEYDLGRICGGPVCNNKTGRITRSTIEGDRAASAAILSGVLAGLQADDPDARKTITRWLEAEEKTGDRRGNKPGGPLSTRAVAARASMLRRAYLWAIADTGVLTLPAPPVPRVNVTYQGGGQAVPRGRVDEFRRAVPDGYREMTDCLIFSGMRVGEVCGLSVADFDPAEGTVTGGSKTEAGRNRRIYLPSWLVTDITRMLMRRPSVDPSDPLFVNGRGSRINPDPYRRRVWHPTARRVGLAGVKPHSMRHTAATEAARSGRSVYDLMEHFGWSDARQARVYVHQANAGVPAIASLYEDRAASA